MGPVTRDRGQGPPGRDAAELGVGHEARVLVEADHLVLVQRLACVADQLLPLAPQQRVGGQAAARAVPRWDPGGPPPQAM